MVSGGRGMAEKAKIVLAIGLGYLLMLMLQLLVNLVLPVPQVLQQQPKLLEQIQKQDVSAQQLANSAERLEEKLKLSRL